jgi:hypothetical protein
VILLVETTRQCAENVRRLCCSRLRYRNKRLEITALSVQLVMSVGSNAFLKHANSEMYYEHAYNIAKDDCCVFFIIFLLHHIIFGCAKVFRIIVLFMIVELNMRSLFSCLVFFFVLCYYI